MSFLRRMFCFFDLHEADVDSFCVDCGRRCRARTWSGRIW